MSAVQARVHYALRQELKLIAGIIRDYTDDEYTYEPEHGDMQVKKSDYKHVDILPVSDPNAATLSQRVVQYQAVIQLAQSAPQIYNLPELHRQMLDVLGIKNADKLVPLDDDQKPKDPVTENMAALKGKPMKAFMFQDHQAHIQVHQMAMQDPIVQQLIGQNPQAQAIMGAMQAHIAEHVGYAYRQKIEDAMGASLPSPKEELSPDLEVELSRLIAQAAPQVLAQSQAMAAQQQAQQNAKDPVMQAELIDQQVKQGELERKKAKDQTDAQFKAKELALKEQELQSKKVQAGIDTATTFINNQQQHQATKRQTLTSGALQLAQLAQQDKEHRLNTAVTLNQQQQTPKESKTK